MKTATTKTCKKCGEEKTLEEFPKPFKWHTKAGEERISQRNTCTKCRYAQQAKNPSSTKEARAEQHKRSYAKNRDKILERNRKWNEANPDWHKDYVRRWRKANHERCLEVDRKWREANQEKVRMAQKKSYLKHQERRAEMSAIQRATRASYESDNHTISELHAYWRANGIDPKRCTYCDAWHTKWANNWKRSQGDHVVPLSRGGKDFVENIVPCCLSCNSSKNCRILYEEWIPPNER